MTDQERLEQIRERCERATPGPWEWDIRHKHNLMQLTTTHSGKYYVMDFARWGMQDACPRFQVYEKYSGPVKERKSHGMERADKMVKPFPGREHHFGYEDMIEHPDAVFIASSKGDVEYLLALVARLTAERDAAVMDLRMLSDELKFCRTCKHDRGKGVFDCGKHDCDEKNLYEWRGVCEENTEGGRADDA